jgi:hypothetical protein
LLSALPPSEVGSLYSMKYFSVTKLNIL